LIHYCAYEAPYRIGCLPNLKVIHNSKIAGSAEGNPQGVRDRHAVLEFSVRKTI
jgi:hypothetical protein